MSWQDLQRGLLQGQEPVGVAGLWGQWLVSTISWQRLGDMQKVTERGFDEEVLGGWIRGQDVETFSNDPIEAEEARIISSSEGKVMGGARGGVGVLGIAVSGSGGQDSHGRRRPWLGCRCRCVGLRDGSRCATPGYRG